MTLKSQTLKKIIDIRGFSTQELSSATKIPANKIVNALNENSNLSKNQIIKLASKLGVPPFVFFMEKFELPNPTIMDYRSSKASVFKYGKDAQRFNSIFKIRDFLADLFKRLDIDPPLRLTQYSADESAEQYANNISKIINIESVRKSAINKSDFYKEFRKLVQSMGIFVIQDHNISDVIDGFSLYHDSFTSNLIYINTAKRNQAANSFTLAHELAHILGKRSAISNNYEFDNEVESFCNEFASCLLIPREDLLHILNSKSLTFSSYEEAVSSASILAEYFKTSITAMLVRLNRTGYVPYSFVTRFKSGFGSEDFPDSLKPPGIPMKNGPPRGTVDLAYFGDRAAALMCRALEQKVTTKYEIFTYTGLPKERIEGLLEVVKSRNIEVQI